MVNDIAEAISFYTKHLGFHVTQAIGRFSMGGVFIRVVAGVIAGKGQGEPVPGS